MSFTARSSSAWRRPVMKTRAPSAANRCAVARPMPLLPPVITAIFPSSFFGMVRPSWGLGVGDGEKIPAREAAARAAASPRVSVGEGAVDLHLGRALRQSFLLAALAIRGEVRRLPVQVERRVVLVHLVEDEEVGVLRGAVRAVDETARLRLPHHACLLGEERGQRIALALCGADLRDYREHVRHWSGSPVFGVKLRDRARRAIHGSARPEYDTRR